MTALADHATATPWPAPSDASSIVLAFANAPVEEAVLSEWLKQAPATKVELLQGPDARLEQALIDAAGDPWIVPVRVAWLPRERNGHRAARLADLASLTNPRKPSPRRQAQILQTEPDRCRVVAGEPARLTELKTRF